MNKIVLGKILKLVKTCLPLGRGRWCLGEVWKEILQYFFKFILNFEQCEYYLFKKTTLNKGRTKTLRITGSLEFASTRPQLAPIQQ